MSCWYKTATPFLVEKHTHESLKEESSGENAWMYYLEIPADEEFDIKKLEMCDTYDDALMPGQVLAKTMKYGNMLANMVDELFGHHLEISYMVAIYDNHAFQIENVQGGYSKPVTTSGELPEEIIADSTLRGATNADDTPDADGAFYSKDGKKLLYIQNANITEYAVKEGCEIICNRAFYCGSLEKVTLPASVKKIGAGAFRGHTKLTHVNLPEGITYIGSYAFLNCRNLEEISLPDSLKYISAGVFRSCERIKSVKLSNNLTYISEELFSRANSLEEIVIPASVTRIGAGAFECCERLEVVQMTDSVTDIEMSAFNGCDSIKSISLSKNLETIGMHAFYSCRRLQHVDFGNSLVSIGDWAFTDDPLIDVVLPEGLLTIGERAFSSHGNISSSIVFPASLQTIADDCVCFKKITFKGVIQKKCKNLLRNRVNDPKQEVYIPKGTLAQYKKLLPGVDLIEN